jgi:hypothetical protein
MSLEDTRRTLTRYFTEMDGGDIASAMAEDVTWSTIDSGTWCTGEVPSGTTSTRCIER